MPKIDKASPRIRAVSLAVHAAGLALYNAMRKDNTALPESILETLPTFYGSSFIDQPLSAGDVAGLLEARRLVNEEARRRADEAMRADDGRHEGWWAPERVAVAAMDAALILLGIDPSAERAPLSQGQPHEEASA